MNNDLKKQFKEFDRSVEEMLAQEYASCFGLSATELIDFPDRLREQLNKRLSQSKSLADFITYPDKPYDSIVVIHSGGFDSFTVLMLALGMARRVTALHFDYGQKHSIETLYRAEQIRRIGKYLNMLASNSNKENSSSKNIPEFKFYTFKIEELGKISQLFGSRLTSSDDSIINEEYSNKEPDTVIPNRNSIFGTYGIAYLLADAKEIIQNNQTKTYRFGLALGVHDSPYIDTQAKFWIPWILAHNHLAQSITDNNQARIDLFAPFLGTTKQTVAEFHNELDHLASLDSYAQITLLDTVIDFSSSKLEKYLPKTASISDILIHSFKRLEIVMNELKQIVKQKFKDKTDEQIEQEIHNLLLEYNGVNNLRLIWQKEELQSALINFNKPSLSNLTYSCYNGSLIHCGICSTCRERFELFSKNIEKFIREHS